MSSNEKIILKSEYPWYTGDEYIEISDEIANEFEKFSKEEHRYKEKVRYHKAFYSLDEDNGISKSILFVSESPDELYEKKLTNQELYKAISMLSELQSKRIYAYYFQNMSMTQIAEIEGVTKMAVSKSIKAGLKNIEKFLKLGFTKR